MEAIDKEEDITKDPKQSLGGQTNMTENPKHSKGGSDTTDEIDDHDKRKYTCKLCQNLKYFLSMKLVMGHLKSDHEILPESFVRNCKYCNKKYASPYTLKSHLLESHMEIVEKEKCEFCYSDDYINCGHAGLENYVSTFYNTKAGNDSNQLLFYQCNYCNYEFRRSEALDEHIESFHEVKNDRNIIYEQTKKIHPCDYCYKPFNSIVKLKEHLRTSSCHHQEELGSTHLKQQFKCKFCLKKFFLEENMNKHVNVLHTCEFCNQTVTNLKIHILQNHRIMVDYSCDICNGTFSTSEKLRSHIVDYHHHLLEYKSCTHCDQIFCQNENWQTHLRVVHKHVKIPKQFMCDICSSVFNKMDNLKQHIGNVHHGNKKYKCNTCGKRFTRSNNLNQHQRKKCSSKLKKSSPPPATALTNDLPNGQHGTTIGITKEHSSDLCKCLVCGANYKNLAALEKHSNEEQHSNFLSSSTKSSVKPVKSGADSYLSKNDYVVGVKCHICHKSFVDSWTYEDHIIKEHSTTTNTFTSPPPGHPVKPEVHQLTTGSAKPNSSLPHDPVVVPAALLHPHQCQLCDKRFQFSTMYDLHMKTVHLPQLSLCKTCNTYFELESDFNEHMHKIHGKLVFQEKSKVVILKPRNTVIEDNDNDENTSSKSFVFTSEQIKILEEFFQNNAKFISLDKRKELSTMTKIPEEEIQKWFANQRLKHVKLNITCSKGHQTDNNMVINCAVPEVVDQEAKKQRHIDIADSGMTYSVSNVLNWKKSNGQTNHKIKIIPENDDAVQKEKQDTNVDDMNKQMEDEEGVICSSIIGKMPPLIPINNPDSTQITNILKNTLSPNNSWQPYEIKEIAKTPLTKPSKKMSMEFWKKKLKNQALPPDLVSIRKIQQKYFCEECGQTFALAKNLKNHNDLIHLGLKYLCVQCFKAFSKADLLKNHINLMHLGQGGGEGSKGHMMNDDALANLSIHVDNADQQTIIFSPEKTDDALAQSTTIVQQSPVFSKVLKIPSEMKTTAKNPVFDQVSSPSKIKPTTTNESTTTKKDAAKVDQHDQTSMFHNCNLCKMGFLRLDGPNGLNKHMNSEHFLMSPFPPNLDQIQKDSCNVALMKKKEKTNCFRCVVCDKVFAKENNLREHLENFHTNTDGENGMLEEMSMYKKYNCEFCQSILWCRISDLKKHTFYCEKNSTNLRKNTSIPNKSAEILNKSINKALNNTRDQMSEMNPVSQVGENLNNPLDNNALVPMNSPVKLNLMNEEGITTIIGIHKEGIDDMISTIPEKNSSSTNMEEVPELENRETLTFINTSAIEELKVEPMDDDGGKEKEEQQSEKQLWESTKDTTRAKCEICNKYFSQVGYLTRHLNSENHRQMLAAIRNKGMMMEGKTSTNSENQKNVVKPSSSAQKETKNQVSSKTRSLESLHEATKNENHCCNLCQKSFTHKKNYLKHVNFFCKARIMEENLCHIYKHKDFKEFGFIRHLTTNLVTCDDPIGSDFLKKPDFNFDELVKSGVLTKIGEMISTKTFMAEKTYNCNICKKIFNQAFQLNRHISLKHGAKGKYHCNKCNKKFISSEYLWLHKRKKHGSTNNRKPAALSTVEKIVQSSSSNDQKQPPILEGNELDDCDNKIYYCPECGKEDDGTPMIGCDNCDNWFHWTCVGIKQEPDENEDWYCAPCQTILIDHPKSSESEDFSLKSTDTSQFPSKNEQKLPKIYIKTEEEEEIDGPVVKQELNCQKCENNNSTEGVLGNNNPMINCNDCHDWYHWICVGIKDQPDDNEDWYCEKCSTHPLSKITKKTYRCHICTRAFSQLNQVNNHIKVAHDQAEHHNCFICHRVMKKRSNLVIHIQKHHPKISALIDTIGPINEILNPMLKVEELSIHDLEKYDINIIENSPIKKENNNIADDEGRKLLEILNGNTKKAVRVCFVDDNNISTENIVELFDISSSEQNANDEIIEDDDNLVMISDTSSNKNTSSIAIKCEPDIDFGIEDIDIDEMIPNVEEFYGFSADGGNLSIQDSIQSYSEINDTKVPPKQMLIIKNDSDKKLLDDNINYQRFTCDHCNNSFKKRRDLQRHINAVHERLKPHSCPFCQMKFSRSDHLKRHVKKGCKEKYEEEEEKLQIRNVISVKYNTTSSYASNKQQKSKDNLRNFRYDFAKRNLEKLQIANVTSVTNQFFQNDSNTTTSMMDPKHHKCYKCDKFFFPLDHLNNHVSTCKGGKNINKSLQIHQLSKRFHCPRCSIWFTNKLILKSHLKNQHSSSTKKKKKISLLEENSNIYIYSCNLCNKKFKHQNILKNHKLWTHSSSDFLNNSSNTVIKQQQSTKSSKTINEDTSKMFQCNICNETFHRVGLLRIHIDSFHKNEKRGVFKCKYCNRICSTQHILSRHILITHNDESLQLASILLKNQQHSITISNSVPPNDLTKYPISKIHRNSTRESKCRQYYGELPKANMNTTTTKPYSNNQKSDLSTMKIYKKLTSTTSAKLWMMNNHTTCNFCKSVFGNCSKDLHIFDSCYIP